MLANAQCLEVGTHEYVSFYPVECFVDALAQWFVVIYLLTRSLVALPTTFARGGGSKMTTLSK